MTDVGDKVNINKLRKLEIEKVKDIKDIVNLISKRKNSTIVGAH